MERRIWFLELGFDTKYNQSHKDLWFHCTPFFFINFISFYSFPCTLFSKKFGSTLMSFKDNNFCLFCLLILFCLHWMLFYCFCLLASCSSRFWLNPDIFIAFGNTIQIFCPSPHDTYTLLCGTCFLICCLHRLHLYSSQCLGVCLAPSAYFLNVY